MAVSGGVAAISAVSSIENSKQQASAQRKQAAFQEQQLKRNAEFMEMQRTEVLAQGEEDVVKRRKQVNEMLGAQRVALAAQGIEVDAGTAADLQSETVEIGHEDVMTIRNNARKKAWGLEVQAEDTRQQGKMAREAGEFNAQNTLATGNTQAFNSVAGAYKRSI